MIPAHCQTQASDSCPIRRTQKKRKNPQQHEKKHIRQLAPALQQAQDLGQAAVKPLQQFYLSRALVQAYSVQQPSHGAMLLKASSMQPRTSFLGQEGKPFNALDVLSCHTSSIQQVFNNLRYHIVKDLGLCCAIMNLSLIAASIEQGQPPYAAGLNLPSENSYPEHSNVVYQSYLSFFYDRVAQVFNTLCVEILPSLSNLQLLWQKAAASWQEALKQYPPHPPQTYPDTGSSAQPSPLSHCSPSYGETASPKDTDSSGCILETAPPYWPQWMGQYERALEHYGVAQIATQQTLSIFSTEVAITKVYLSGWLSTLAPAIGPRTHQQALAAFSAWLETWLQQASQDLMHTLRAPQGFSVWCHGMCPSYQLSLAASFHRPPDVP